MKRIVAAVLAVAVLALGAAAVEAAKEKPGAKASRIGMAAPDFKGLEGTDGKSYSLADMKDKDVVVLCITCNHCPVAVAYEDRIIDFAKKYGKADSKVGFIAINVNNSAADKLDKMKERAKEKGFNFPYAYDPSQKIATELGAAITPEFFVFDKERKLVYTGPMDDSMKSPKTNYLEPAVEAALKGEKPAKAQVSVAGRGCGIQYDRKKN